MSRVTSNDGAATLLDTSRRGPRLVLIMDDQFVSNKDALLEADKRGQKLNLAVMVGNVGLNANYMTWNDIRAAAMRGHGILSHSMTHRKMSDLTPAEVAAEYDDSIKLLTTKLNVPVSGFVYPTSARNTTTDSIGYLRFPRMFSGSTIPSRARWYRPKSFVHGRFAWDNTNHQQVKDEVVAAAAANEDIVVYCHATSSLGTGFGANYNTVAQFTELLDLALKLRMDVVHVAELGDPQLLTDPGFEDAANYANNFDFVAVSGGAGSASIVADAPAEGLPGTQSLKITSTSATGYVLVRAKKLIPTAAFAEAGASLFAGARVRVNRTSGTGTATVRIRNWDKDRVPASGTTGISTEWSSAAWSSVGEVKTPAVATNENFPFVSVEFFVAGMVGDVFFDHAQLTSTSAGVIA